MEKLFLSVVDEEVYLEESVNRLINIDLFKEIILVDNNSTDKSREIASSFVDRYQNIYLVSAFEKRGKGYSVYTGLKHASSTLNSPRCRFRILSK